jgi:hypothetical protein
MRSFWGGSPLRKVAPPKRDKERYEKTRRWANAVNEEVTKSFDMAARAINEENEKTVQSYKDAKKKAAHSDYSKQVAARVRNETVQTFRSAYQILHIPRTATSKAIKQAYVVQALRYHPDRAGTEDSAAALEWAAIVEAYAHLKDPTDKREYDHDLPIWKAVHQFYADNNPAFANKQKIADAIDGHRERYGEEKFAPILFENLAKRYEIKAYAPFQDALQEMVQSPQHC